MTVALATEHGSMWQNAVGHHALFFRLEQTQENLQKFEHQAGLTDVRYSPHRGLSAEETQFHRLGDVNLPVSMSLSAHMWVELS